VFSVRESVLADSREGHEFGLGRTRLNLGWLAKEEGEDQCKPQNP
jgi:hypothetical protein